MAEPNDKFRILSVDGGGMRGLIPGARDRETSSGACRRRQARMPA